jgi:DNA-binding response OmpR family regulator
MLEHFALQPTVGDIVLLDIMLPGISGEVAISELRRRGLSVPVMMLTAKRDLETRVRTLERGADDYLAKPFDVEELVARVNALLRRAKPISDLNLGD